MERKNLEAGWYVSHLGQVEQLERDPGIGWSRLMDPDQLPDNYHPEQGDIWAHGVVAPDGMSLVVPMIVDKEGNWHRDGDVQYLDVFYEEHLQSNEVSTIRGIGNKDGKAMEQEVWYEAEEDE